MMGYALVFISHSKDKTFTREDGTEYNQIVPTLSNSYNEIIKNMVDFYLYGGFKATEEGTKRVLFARSYDGSIDCGSRFKYIQPEIDLSYEALVKAVNIAIDRQAEETGVGFVTNERIIKEETKIDFASLKAKFQSMIDKITSTQPEKMNDFWAPEITKITTKYLGKDKKVTTCTEENAGQIELIIAELEDLMKANNI